MTKIQDGKNYNVFNKNKPYFCVLQLRSKDVKVYLCTASGVWGLYKILVARLELLLARCLAGTNPNHYLFTI